MFGGSGSGSGFHGGNMAKSALMSTSDRHLNVAMEPQLAATA